MLSCGLQSQQTLKVSHDAAMLKVDELSAQLKDERLKALDLEKRLQSANVSKIQTQQARLLTVHLHHVQLPWLQVDCSLLLSCVVQLQERISELEQERDVLKDNNETLLTR